MLGAKQHRLLGGANGYSGASHAGYDHRFGSDDPVGSRMGDSIYICVSFLGGWICTPGKRHGMVFCDDSGSNGQIGLWSVFPVGAYHERTAGTWRGCVLSTVGNGLCGRCSVQFISVYSLFGKLDLLFRPPKQKGYSAVVQTVFPCDGLDDLRIYSVDPAACDCRCDCRNSAGRGVPVAEQEAAYGISAEESYDNAGWFIFL